MKDNEIKQIVEALLMVSGRPLKIEELARLLTQDKENRVPHDSISKVLSVLTDECKERGIELVKVASGYRYQTRAEFSQYLAKLWEERPPRYSHALLETLALIAYRQPITRAEIEEVRGVSVSSRTIQILQERGWIKISAHKEVPGRPALYVTTKIFLDYFNLQSADDLPTLLDDEKVIQLHPELNIPEVPATSLDKDPDGTDTDKATADNNNELENETEFRSDVVEFPKAKK